MHLFLGTAEQTLQQRVFFGGLQKLAQVHDIHETASKDSAQRCLENSPLLTRPAPRLNSERKGNGRCHEMCDTEEAQRFPLIQREESGRWRTCKIGTHFDRPDAARTHVSAEPANGARARIFREHVIRRPFFPALSMHRGSGW